ncbi:dTDP-4-dehydrorhamnose reductase [Fluviibacterium sp. S390]|uniref:dTDP-4-dehydrorhamnose reductase n=1 Tax=Fluviibacterium sp. S390 TaxID=3415139 RepID=UPI003C7CE32C
MKILVFGRNGQVARELQRRAGGVELEVYGSDEADFRDTAACVARVQTTDADAVINAAAYTAVDKAEEEEPLATLINGDTPAALAKVCAERGLPFVQISTDYVFDGSGEYPWSVDSPSGPLGAYGRSKLAGEMGVRQAGGNYVILRTSWVVSAHGRNFVKTMLKLGAERDRLTIVADQVGGPTSAADIADACLEIARQLKADPEKYGTYHFSGGPDVSWADFAREIFRQADLNCEVADIPSSDFPTPAKRPFNSRMDNSLTESIFGISRPDWRVSLAAILSDIQAGDGA